MALLAFPYATIFDTAGNLEPGAKAYFYVSGTSTPLDTYSDADLTTANSNPVIADGAGALGPIYLKPQDYKIVIKDASDSTIKTIDKYSPIPSGEQLLWAGTVGGTANAVLLTTAPLIASLRDGTIFWWRAASANTTAVTINLDGTGAKSLVWPNGTAMAAGDIAANAIVFMSYNGSTGAYNNLVNTAPPFYRTGGTLSGTLTMAAALNMAAEVTIPSATTINIGAAASNNIAVSGTTTITGGDTVAAGITRTIRFTGTPLLTHSTTWRLPGSANVQVVAGDTLTMLSLGSGTWVFTNYSRADGKAPVGSAGLLLARQTFTSSGTYTPTSGMASCDVTIIGGGGSGGAVNSTARGAGGSGAGVKVRFSAATIGASKAVTIGAGGAGVVPSNVGNAGGASSLGTLVVVGGGAGGTVSSLGGAGGTVSTSGDINVKGRAGSGQSAGIVNDTRGGDSPFGLGTGGEGLSGANGVAGNGYGAGGSAASTGTSGAGAAGICIIEEYS